MIRAELCHEAIRLAALLAEHPSGDRPRVHALLALSKKIQELNDADTSEAAEAARRTSSKDVRTVSPTTRMPYAAESLVIK